MIRVVINSDECRRQARISKPAFAKALKSRHRGLQFSAKQAACALPACAVSYQKMSGQDFQDFFLGNALDETDLNVRPWR